MMIGRRRGCGLHCKGRGGFQWCWAPWCPPPKGCVRSKEAEFVVCRRHPRPCDDPPRRPLPASEAPKQAATHRPPSSAPSGGGTSSSAGKGAVVRPQQQSASVVDLLPKTALVQAARRLADVPSHAMLIFKQQQCSRREVEEEAKKDKVKSSHPGPRSGRTRAFFRAGLSFAIEASSPKGRLRPFTPGSSESEIDHIRPREENGEKHVFFTPRAFSKTRSSKCCKSTCVGEPKPPRNRRFEALLTIVHAGAARALAQVLPSEVRPTFFFREFQRCPFNGHRAGALLQGGSSMNRRLFSVLRGLSKD
jgi:hypothetical protein